MRLCYPNPPFSQLAKVLTKIALKGARVVVCTPVCNFLELGQFGSPTGFCLVSVLPYPGGGGGWVGLAEFQGGWVSNPPPPGWGGTLRGPLGLSGQCHFFLSSVAGSV